MKLILVLVVFCAIATAAPADDSKNAVVVSYENEPSIGNDGYKFSFETSDGTKRSEEATLKNVGTENESISIRGTISWIAPDGVTYTINFVADENGFQPEGDHLPKRR